MPGAKILIAGTANSGKTTLLKTLVDAFVISRDGKPFSLPIAHVNMPDWSNMNEFLDIVENKFKLYEERMGKYPATVAFDSVSTIFTEIVVNSTIRYENFKIWENVDKEINQFLQAINELQNMGLNVVLITHLTYESGSKKYVEVTAGKFGHKGGFIANVDYALHIELIGKKRIITHRGDSLSRTHLDSLPDKEDSSTFNLQNYVSAIQAMSTEVTEKWSF